MGGGCGRLAPGFHASIGTPASLRWWCLNWAMMDLSGQLAIVTGGGKGVGKLIAELIATAGGAVALVGRTEAPLQRHRVEAPRRRRNRARCPG